MQSTLLFKFKTRQEAQDKLTKVLNQGGNDRAEIRENPSSAGDEHFEVWSGPVSATDPVDPPATR